MESVQSGIFNYTKLDDNRAEFCVISDLHIGNDASPKCAGRNDYVFSSDGNPLSGEAYTLKRFCDKIIISGKQGLFNDNKHMLVLLGDVINGEYGYTSCYYSYAYRLLLSSIEPWLYTSNIIYVAGNHDKDAKFFSDVAGFPRLSLVETVKYNTREDNMFSRCGIIFEHGHKFDYLCSGKNFLGLMGTFASDIVANVCSPDLEDLLRGRDYYTDQSSDNKANQKPKQVTLDSLNSEDRRVANGALDFISKQPRIYHTIICGHTHQMPVEIIADSSGRILTYYNTGKFARGNVLNVLVEQDKFGRWRLIG